LDKLNIDKYVILHPKIYLYFENIKAFKQMVKSIKTRTELEDKTFAVLQLFL